MGRILQKLAELFAILVSPEYLWYTVTAIVFFALGFLLAAWIYGRKTH
jgi:hypothetical protein